MAAHAVTHDMATKIRAEPGGDHGTEARDWRLGLPVLVAHGVTLREPRLSDAPSLCAMLATQDVGRFMTAPPDTPSGFQQFIAWIQRERRAGRCFCYGIVPAGAQDAVGLIQLRQLEPGFGTGEWGFALGQPFWGTGLFLASARLAVDFTFREVGMHRLEARSAIQNGRANGVLGKLGAVPEGILRRSLISRQCRSDQVLWALLADDWLHEHPEPLYCRDAPLTQAPEVAGLPAPPQPTTARWRHGLPVLAGARLSLRELRASDAHSLVRLLTTEEVVRFILPPPNTVEGFEQFIEWAHEKRQSGTHVCYGVVPAGSDEVVGLFQVQQLDPTFSTAEWGFVLGQPFWGTGMFREAAQLVLGFAFDTIGVRRLEARTAHANARGNGALHKMGAKREAHLRRSFLLGGAYSDDVLWAILDEDWRQSGSRRVPNSATGGS